MCRVLEVAIMALCSCRRPLARGQTQLPCPLLENDTLPLSGSPYLLVCDLDMENVVIEPGVRIEADGNYELRILGGLSAIGTPRPAHCVYHG